MAWEILAIWAIVIVAVTWFVRDEKRARAEAKLAHAARYFAHAPKYRHVTVEPIEAPRTAPVVQRQGGLTDRQRAFLEELAKPRTRATPSSL